MEWMRSPTHLWQNADPTKVLVSRAEFLNTILDFDYDFDLGETSDRSSLKHCVSGFHLVRCRFRIMVASCKLPNSTHVAN